MSEPLEVVATERVRLPRRDSRAVVGLFVVACVLAALALFAAVNAHTAAIKAHMAAMDAQSAIQHHDALCTAIVQLAKEQPPAGDPKTNPSRAFEQDQHTAFVQLRDHFGC